MAYDQKQFIQKLDRWGTYMENFNLPTWEALPDMELYMDRMEQSLPKSQKAGSMSQQELESYLESLKQKKKPVE